MIEVALAHIIGDKVENAYQRGDLLDKRRKLMHAWAAYCDSRARPATWLRCDDRAQDDTTSEARAEAEAEAAEARVRAARRYALRDHPDRYTVARFDVADTWLKKMVKGNRTWQGGENHRCLGDGKPVADARNADVRKIAALPQGHRPPPHDGKTIQEAR